MSQWSLAKILITLMITQGEAPREQRGREFLPKTGRQWSWTLWHGAETAPWGAQLQLKEVMTQRQRYGHNRILPRLRSITPHPPIALWESGYQIISHTWGEEKAQSDCWDQDMIALVVRRMLRCLRDLCLGSEILRSHNMPVMSERMYLYTYRLK